MPPLLVSARFTALPLLQLIAVVTLIAGGPWTWLGGMLLLAGVVLFDETGGDFRKPVSNPNPVFFETVLYSTLPLTAMMTYGLLYLSASEGSVMAAAAGMAGAEHGASLAVLAGAVFSVGMLQGATTSYAHELFHRTSYRDWMCAQFLLAQCLYAPLALEHVFGHHKNVGFANDVVTVPRGMTMWRYLPRAIFGTYLGAARIEAARMKRAGAPWYALRNRFVQGLLLQAALIAAIFLISGPGGLAGFLACTLVAIIFVEMSNYVGHYGVVREPGQPVCPRHSWNGPRFASTSILINLQRHSDHHRAASRPYWKLDVLEDAPVYPLGMGLMSVIALVPPLWFRIIEPHIEDWDMRLASDGELLLLGDEARVQAAHRVSE